MAYRQLFFIEGKLLGEAPRKAILRQGTIMEPTSDLYFCRVCGGTYAKLPCLRPDGQTTPWQSHRGTCRMCASFSQFFSDFPGSIWRSWDEPFLEALPVAVLQWELSCHLDNIERFPNGYQ